MSNASSFFRKAAKRSLKYIYFILDFICSYLEMHLVKIVAFTIMFLCCSMVNALHMIVVVMILMCLLFGLTALQFSFSFIGTYLSVLFLSKMAYQTKLVPDFHKDLNCSNVNDSFHSIITNTILDPEWWGFEGIVHHKLISYYDGYILVFVVMTLQAVIRLRQKIIRLDAGLPPGITMVMYPKTTRADADMSLKDCLKFIINYGFYKFGIEISLSYCVLVICYRVDVFSVLYTVWLFILLFPNRPTVAILWPFFFTTLLFSILWQYTMAVGISKRTCFEYPWKEQEGLIKWLFLPSFEHKPKTSNTLMDFVLLLLIQRQMSVFELEKKYGDKYPGGSNEELRSHNLGRDFVNPVPDHTLGVKSWIGIIKLVFMTWFFRITLAFLFWNGATNTGLLSLGYLVAAFVFLWIDYDFSLWPINKILKWWNILLAFTVIVILVKILLEFLRCIFEDYVLSTFPWIIRLLCIHRDEKSLLADDHYFTWDVICFFCIIFQRRHFRSYYFLHEKEDISAIFRLQAKGAKVIDELQELRIREFQQRERKTLMKIKKNMNRIKAWQKRIQGLNYNEPIDHATAIYMGDYCMFEDIRKVKVSSSSSESEEKMELSVTEFLETVFNREKTIKELSKEKAARSAKKGGKTKEKGRKKSKGDPKKVASAKSIKDKPKKGSFRLFLINVMVFLIRFCNKQSKDYRLIRSLIKRERTLLKGKASEGSQRNESSLANKVKVTEDEDKDSESDENYENKSLKNLLMILLIALIKFLLSKSELICYLGIFIHTILSPNMISLPLPIMVFLWGSLTSVRPTTTFWTVLIAYTEVAVVIKAIFQNSIFPWNNSEKKSTTRAQYPPLFLGIQKDTRFVTADLILLINLFLHRYKLKTLGLWIRTHEEETLLPQDLQVYKELVPERELKDIKGNRSLVQQRKLLMAEGPDPNALVTTYLQTAIWKCTSRGTARVVQKKNKALAKIRVKEIEGMILVTHEGRRLQPVFIQISQMPEDELEGNLVLRVYSNDIIIEPKFLSCRLSWVQHFTTIRKFFFQILVRDWRVSSDFYTLTFIFQFLNFVIIFFGYSSFADPVDIQSEDYFSLVADQVPPMYLFTIIIHFLVIIVDRIIYLTKCTIGKLILQIILVILVHTWMFILMPIVTESSFNRLYVRQTYYIITCFYFLMSAYQLRAGYPMRVQGHFLCNKYGYFNYYAYKLLQFLPFFNQLRIVLDYLCIQTSMSLMEWIKMESIFQVVFENKCSREVDIRYPWERGKPTPKWSKYCPGTFTFLGLIVVIWFPFIIFALFNTVAQPNLPQEGRLELHIGKFGKIYTSIVSLNDIITLTESQYKALRNLYKNNLKVRSFLSMYDNKDVGILKFRFEPYSPWCITPTEFRLLNETVQNLALPITLYVQWIIKRIPRLQIVPTSKDYREIILKRNDTAREQLADAFLKKNNTKVRLNHVLPRFVIVSNEGKIKPVSRIFGYSRDYHRNLTIELVEDGNYYWWRLAEVFEDTENEEKISVFENEREITMYTFNEKNTPKLLLNVRKKGILGLYLSLVFVLWTFIKRIMLVYPRLMFTEIPYPDPVLQLCYDIYLARECHEFALEEDLFAKLLFLFRSPETMIKVTRFPTLQQG